MSTEEQQALGEVEARDALSQAEERAAALAALARLDAVYSLAAGTPFAGHVRPSEPTARCEVLAP